MSIKKLKKLTALTSAVCSISFMGTEIIASAEYLPGQIKPPSEFFLFEDNSGKYLCFKNSYGTYTIGDNVKNYELCPQIDWNDGKWNYTEDWDNIETYKSKYDIKGDKISDISGSICLVGEDNEVFNKQDRIPQKMRIRYIVNIEKEDGTLVTEKSQWSEEIDTTKLPIISLDNFEILAPTICNVSESETGKYAIETEGKESFDMLYGLPNYQLVMYVEAKSRTIDWTNIMSTMVFSQNETVTLELPESFLSEEDNISFRCKYGIAYKDETLSSPWSNIYSKGVKLEDAEFISNGDAVFEKGPKAEQSLKVQDQHKEQNEEASIPDKGIQEKIGITLKLSCTVAVCALLIYLYIKAYNKKQK